MFCSNCGKEINDKAVICIGCGVAVGKSHVTGGQDTYKPILGFILSFIIPLVGAIIATMEYKKAKETGGEHRFALAGMLIGYIYTGIIVLYVIVVLIFLGAVFSAVDYYYIFSMFR